MASSSTPKEETNTEMKAQLEEFNECLKSSKRVLALLGAGFSAASGLPTFRGAGGFWRNYEATKLATPEAFERDPGLVWEFYSYRRHLSLQAKPNPGHYALAKLAEVHPDFITLSQNVDGLSPRAGHPSDKIHFLHGDLFTVKCSNTNCTYTTQNFDDPITPSLSRAISSGFAPPAPTLSSLPPIPLLCNTPQIPHSDLPKCPKCTSLLRPGVVWFGEDLPETVIDTVDAWIDEAEEIDLIMVIGTSSTVWPAAGYVWRAREKGARVAVVNLEPDEVQLAQVQDGDWLFVGDSGVLVPEMVRGLVGDLGGEKGS